MKMTDVWEAFGERKTVAEWLLDKRTTVEKGALRWRITEGWTIEDALTTPLNHSGNFSLVSRDLPPRLTHPKHKAKIESGKEYIQKYFIPARGNLIKIATNRGSI
jgi:hypothetical protein